MSREIKFRAWLGDRKDLIELLTIVYGSVNAETLKDCTYDHKDSNGFSELIKLPK